MHMHPDNYPRQQTNMKMVTILVIAILVLAGALFILFPSLAWASDRPADLCCRVPNGTRDARNAPCQVSMIELSPSSVTPLRRSDSVNRQSFDS